MIKDPTNLNTAKINVYLRDGRSCLGCDIPSKPMGEHDRFVSFWFQRALRVIPLDLVKEIKIYFDDEA